ncbi:acyl-CoA thioesterase [Actinospica sp. MGRD01-02]|uniref:Acyl-CoA thioesterase n=1 Tax=Actinospica acidithermotolerans TaxID=2828514 RepID=A0A941IJ46_9ACTN|nr:thioesterase family protein [Actinospica acidithermotolerans]MBR7830340.1 acyl-CoA thioesterase [Actinospica acidithermotolerans]
MNTSTQQPDPQQPDGGREPAGEAATGRLPEPAGNAQDGDAVAGGPVVARAVHRGRVEWMDTDASGHYHNSSIIRFVEAAEAALMRERDLPEYFGISPRVHYEVDYPAKLWFGQEVTTTLVLERIGTSSLTFRFEVWGEADEKNPRALAARGRFVTAYVPLGSSRSEPWPEDWRRRLSTAPIADQPA